MSLSEVPDYLIYPLEVFSDEFNRHYERGNKAAKNLSVAIVGLARNCAMHMAYNLGRAELLGRQFAEYRIHVETNDNTDATDQVLVDARRHLPLTFQSRRLGRSQRGGEFAGPRTVELAEYRAACQQWVRELRPLPDLVVVLDWDMWGGWSHAGLVHGIGWMLEHDDAYGMASVSLMQWPAEVTGGDGATAAENVWLHYDAWALRLNSFWDDYTAGLGAWKQTWLPPVGSPPVPVCSAFGGLAVYRTWAYLAGEYGGEDCEHVVFHRTIHERLGKRLYLDPSMRSVMHWVTDGRQHCDH
jgi:hypothetical protein